MKTLVLSLFLFITISKTFSQRFQEVVKWEIHTINGGLVVGASPNMTHAQSVISDFKTRNYGLRYEALSFKTGYVTMPVRKSEDPLSLLHRNTERGYVVLSPEQLRVLKLVGKTAFSNLVSDYAITSEITYEEAVQEITILSIYGLKKSPKLQGLNMAYTAN